VAQGAEPPHLPGSVHRRRRDWWSRCVGFLRFPSLARFRGGIAVCVVRRRVGRLFISKLGQKRKSDQVRCKICSACRARWRARGSTWDYVGGGGHGTLVALRLTCGPHAAGPQSWLLTGGAFCNVGFAGKADGKRGLIAYLGLCEHMNGDSIFGSNFWRLMGQSLPKPIKF
jgi:hypothetical protein